MNKYLRLRLSAPFSDREEEKDIILKKEGCNILFMAKVYVSIDLLIVDTVIENGEELDNHKTDEYIFKSNTFEHFRSFHQLEKCTA